MLKFLMNELFDPSEARHITHCANVESAKRKTHAHAITAIVRIRIVRCDFIWLLSPAKAGSKNQSPITIPAPEVLGYFQTSANADAVLLGSFGRRRWSGITQILRAKTVREENQQQADRDYYCRNDRQDQIQTLKPQVHEISNDQRRFDD